MNAAEFSTRLTKLINEGLQTGVVQRKMGFETMLGIMETQKQMLHEWRMQKIMAEEAAKQPGIIIGKPHLEN